jgi:hypothetical protein
MGQMLLPEHRWNKRANFGHSFGRGVPSGGNAPAIPGVLVKIAGHLAVHRPMTLSRIFSIKESREVVLKQLIFGKSVRAVLLYVYG